jgi:preprotein translocase subunit SecG
MNIIRIIQAVVGILIITAILLQQRSSGLSAIFGGEGGSFYRSRRGLEKIIFIGTIVLTIIFIALSIYSLLSF